MYFWIFPVAVFGSSETMRTVFGHLKCANCSLTNSRSSASVAEHPTDFQSHGSHRPHHNAPPTFSSDLKGYVYSYSRITSDLYVLDGLK